MALPTLTPAQRHAALTKAAHVRKQRADIRTQLRKRKLTLADVFTMANQGDEVVRGARIAYVLASLPRITAVEAQDLMAGHGIPPNRRVGGLGPRQREALLRDTTDQAAGHAAAGRPAPVRAPAAQPTPARRW